MDTLECIRTRRSCKSYKPDMPSDELIGKVVEAGTYAPTGMGMQSPLIVAVTNKEIRDELSCMNAEVLGTNYDPFYGAPVIVVVLADKARGTYINDGSLVMENMMLAAHDLGLGSCWIHRAKQVFSSERGRQLLKEWGIEGDYEGIAHLALGYRDGDFRPSKPRKPDYIRYVR